MSADIPAGLRPRLPGGFRLPPLGMHQVLALGIVAVALWAMGLIGLGVQMIGQWVGSWQNEIRIHVYLDSNASARPDALRDALAAIPGVQGVRVVSQDEAVAWMHQWLEGTGVDDATLAKRLPISFEVSLGEHAGKFLFRDIRDVAQKFGANVNQEEISLARAHDWLQNLRSLAWFMEGIMALAMALIIANTLRITLIARAEELHLMRLMGAAEWFVRMPFLLEGVLLGLVAGLLAWAMQWPLVWALGDWLRVLSVQPQLGLLLPELVLGGALTGLLGAMVATLRRISPDLVDY
ncbi:MAG TPA: permease-like cell division protein FtsX [Mariprofundaceae bacterium]|nr:permease-like cell division protein FtsX [Mariprofundaceae bacterium]